MAINYNKVPSIKYLYKKLFKQTTNIILKAMLYYIIIITLYGLYT